VEDEAKQTTHVKQALLLVGHLVGILFNPEDGGSIVL
jgi:hypothetical protein